MNSARLPVTPTHSATLDASGVLEIAPWIAGFTAGSMQQRAPAI